MPQSCTIQGFEAFATELHCRISAVNAELRMTDDEKKEKNG